MPCRRLYAEDGRFEVGNIQDWQHSAMYMAFLLSGVVDLVAYKLPEGVLPDGIEHVSKERSGPCHPSTAMTPLLLMLHAAVKS